MPEPVPEETVTSRSTPEITPCVSVPARLMLYGVPMATTGSPTESASELPSSMGVRFSASIFRTARSEASSLPTSSASYSVPS